MIMLLLFTIPSAWHFLFCSNNLMILPFYAWILQLLKVLRYLRFASPQNLKNILFESDHTEPPSILSPFGLPPSVGNGEQEVSLMFFTSLQRKRHYELLFWPFILLFFVLLPWRCCSNHSLSKWIYAFSTCIFVNNLNTLYFWIF